MMSFDARAKKLNPDKEFRRAIDADRKVFKGTEDKTLKLATAHEYLDTNLTVIKNYVVLVSTSLQERSARYAFRSLPTIRLQPVQDRTEDELCNVFANLLKAPPSSNTACRLALRGARTDCPIAQISPRDGGRRRGTSALREIGAGYLTTMSTNSLRLLDGRSADTGNEESDSDEAQGGQLCCLG